MASILVTGAAGFLGSNLCRTLLEERHTVHGADNLITGSQENATTLATYPNFTFHQADITDPAFSKLFTARFDEIYHLACPTGVPNLKLIPLEMLHTCSDGMFNVLELARAHGAKLLYTSTAEMYGQPEKFPQDEGYNGNVDPLGERSAYEEGKRFSESCLAAYVRVHTLNARVARVFNTYGPGMSLNDKRVIPQFIGNVLRNEPLRVYGDGSQTRTHLFVDDNIRGLRVVMEKGTPGEAYNIGGDTQMTVRELAELVIEMTGHAAGIEYKPHFIEDHRGRLPSTEKARALGWEKKVSTREGLQRMINAYLPIKEIEKLAPASPTGDVSIPA